MSESGNHLFVITGGPGSGKSALVDALAAHGFAHVPEAGRAIIREQVAAGGSALPWSDSLAFAESMLERDLRAYHASLSKREPVIFDRGIPDVVGYLRLSKLAVPDHFHKAAQRLRYNVRVFIAPPWPEIFVQDAERKQTPEEAEATHAAMANTYTGYGYDLVTLPRAPIDARVRFVTGRIGAWRPRA